MTNMPKKLQSYDKNQRAKVPKPLDPTPSGIECTDFVPEKRTIEVKKVKHDKKGKARVVTIKEKAMVKDGKKCGGEMMIHAPVQKHPELKELQRATCDKCGWRGWV